MKYGTRIRTTIYVRSKEGFIPPSTDGKILLAVGDNAYRCEFADVEIATSAGTTKKVTATATVLANSIYEIPSAQIKKPLS